MRPGNHVCECVGTSCFMYVFWTVVVCRRMDLRKRAKNSKVKSRYKKFKEYASVVDKQQTCSMSWRRWRSRKIKSGEYVLITRYVEYVWICVSEWTKLFSHNSEKNELLESMVHPLEVMRRELKDIVKGSMEVSYIITTNVPHKMTSQYLSSPQLHNWFPMMSSVNDWNWCTDQMEKWQGLSNFLPM